MVDRPTLRRGDRGALVKELQTRLHVDADGIFGAATEAALKQFQRDNGLVADGVAGPRTWAALDTEQTDPDASAGGPIDEIIRIAAASDIARFSWKDRGLAPVGYIKGMALVYGRVYCKLQQEDAAVTDMARAKTMDADRDALAWYSDVFDAAGMNNDSASVDTLRHLFVLLIGLGMRESSGKHCEGRDMSASNTTAETAEAGLFQTSFNARTASLENFGAGDGKEFQRLSKECPAFAAEFTAVALRHRRKHWGPINRKGAEVRPECDAMLLQVQAVVDASPGICSALL
jgi:Putative peptidoglycan binding domain